MAETRRAADDAAFMRRALDLALQGWGQTAPNPLVGAVVVRDGAVVGEGFHARFGESHAEVNALRAAGERARGATLYVSLEPCRHHGKTPPCTDAILAAGVTRVVVGTLDPTREAGGGAATLRDVGVELTVGVLEAEARRVDPAFFHAAVHDTPFTTLKLAVSIETAIARVRGESSWLTGPESRVEVHRLRAGSDAIAVGVGTVLADDPTLTVREWTAPRVAPVRVVFDKRLETPPSSSVVRSAREVPTIVVTARAEGDRAGVLRAAGVMFIEAATLTGALRALRQWTGGGHDGGIRSLLVEGGARLARDAMQQGLIHRLAIFQSPIALGAQALHAFDGASPALVRRLEALPVTERRQVGADMLTMYAEAAG